MSRGSRDSPWLVLRRCLAIIRRVQRGPAQWRELVEAVREQEPEAYGTATGSALRKRLENDLHRIRDCLGIDLYYSRREKGYVIRDLWVPLLDLPDEDLVTLAWLAETFGPESPHHERVHALINRLRLFLGMERQAQVVRYRSLIEMELRPRDTDSISPSVREQLERALAERRWVAFDYRSPQYADGCFRRHEVAPERCYYDVARGHYYLRGWCKKVTGPEGTTPVDRYITYRLGRMTNVQILPDVLPPHLPRPRRYEVVYELAPEVARLGVSYHPEIIGQQVEYREDGSALVRGETEELFFVVQVLLRYGSRCRVLGGPELLAEMRRTVKEMGKMYEEF